MSGSSSSTLAVVLGVVVGTIAFLGLVALVAFRYREKRRAREELLMGSNHGDSTRDYGGELNAGGSRQPPMNEGPRPAFRHESFMALVKDAAQGFYAPSMEAQPLNSGGSATAGPSTGAGAGAGAAGAGAATAVARGGVSRQASAATGPTRQSTSESLQYLDTGTASPTSPPPATIHPDFSAGESRTSYR
ncbi:hypothetical protein BGZ68_001788 [Mortierella alpina]|nr:hypothetical protein BGZ68_001788 [Mortierella alpina]